MPNGAPPDTFLPAMPHNATPLHLRLHATEALSGLGGQGKGRAGRQRQGGGQGGGAPPLIVQSHSALQEKGCFEDTQGVTETSGACLGRHWEGPA